jgi:hypothetical protein
MTKAAREFAVGFCTNWKVDDGDNDIVHVSIYGPGGGTRFGGILRPEHARELRDQLDLALTRIADHRARKKKYRSARPSGTTRDLEEESWFWSTVSRMSDVRKLLRKSYVTKTDPISTSPKAMLEPLGLLFVSQLGFAFFFFGAPAFAIRRPRLNELFDT